MIEDTNVGGARPDLSGDCRIDLIESMVRHCARQEAALEVRSWMETEQAQRAISDAFVRQAIERLSDATKEVLANAVLDKASGALRGITITVTIREEPS